MTLSSSSGPADLSGQRQTLRRELLAQRRQLDIRTQQRAAMALYRRVSRWLRFHQAERLAFYLPAGGEIDPRPLLHHSLRAGAQCCLPALSPLHEGKMYFVPVREGDTLQHNRWGIPEAGLHHTLPPRTLDITFVPLVGFDRQGNRLGMGKGFYDRCFAFRRRKPDSNWPAPQRPILAGLAHDCQQVESIPAEDWDVRLDVIFTPRSMIIAG